MVTFHITITTLLTFYISITTTRTTIPIFIITNLYLTFSVTFVTFNFTIYASLTKPCSMGLI